MIAKSKKKTQEVKLTLEQKLEKELKNLIGDHTFLPEATYQFEVGDYVLHNREYWTVIEKFENGKFYTLSSVRASNVKTATNWLNIYAKDTYQLNESIFKKNILTLNPSTICIADLLNNLHYFGTDMEPSYQRDLVWTPKQQNDFLASVFDENISLGTFYFIKKQIKGGEDFMYEIFDGKQRLNTLSLFRRSKIAFETGQQLIHYYNLCPIDKRSFNNRNTGLCEIPDVDTKTKIELFIKLNTSGMPIAESHIQMLKNKLFTEDFQ